MRKITVTEDPHLTSLFPKHLANRVSVTLTSGKQYVSEMLDGPGTPENPMTYRDFEHKFRRMAEPHISMKAQNEVLHFVNTLANQTHYDNLFSAMRK
jgi:2-methylcitrate dehydratase